MNQVLRKGFKDIVVTEVPDPALIAHHVLVRPCYSLISSGTETASIHPDVLKTVRENPSHLQTILNVARVEGPVKTFNEVRAKFDAYAVLGYSGAGYVSAKHQTVTDLEIGDRVVYGGEGTGHGETISTGRNLVAPIPEDVSFEHACFTTLGCIAMNAVRTAQIGVGDTVAVVGLGLVGQLIAQLARLQGAVVAGFDLRADRADLAKNLGADYAFTDPASVKEGVLGITGGRGADCVIIAAASKSDAPCRAAVSMCRDRGRIVVVGAVEMSFPWDEMYIKEIQVLMSRAYGPGSYDAEYERKGRDYPVSYVRWTENRNMQEFLRLLEARKVDVAPLISHVYPLAEAPAAYGEIMNGSGGSLAMVLRYPQADFPVPAAQALKQTVFTPNVAAPAAAPGTIRAAVVGVGGIFRWAHMPALEKIPDVSLRAVYSSSGARGKTCAERYKAVYCTTDYEEVLRDRDTNLVIVVSRNQYHASQTAEALRAGKHVFVEKPMALTVDECRDVYNAVQESGKQLTVGFNRRFAPYYVAQRKRLMRRSGPAVINIRVNSPGISYPYWMADPAIGGAILGEACHFVDLFYWLLGSEPTRVYAHSLPTGSTEPVGQNNLCATFQFADGSIGTLNYSTVGSKTSQGERVECFAQGFGVTTENFKSLAIHEDSSKVETKLLPRKGYDSQMKSFIEAVREGRKPAVTVVDGVRATVGCLRMLDSARTGEPRDIDLAGVIA